MITLYNSDFNKDTTATKLSGQERDVKRAVDIAERRHAEVDLYYHGADGKPRHAGLKGRANRVLPTTQDNYDPLMGEL